MSETTIYQDLLSVQKEVSKVGKNASNPYFKSKYADLPAVIDAVYPLLNDKGIVVMQPTIRQDDKTYVNTQLIKADTGEKIECLTEVILARQNDAQVQGSGITYARRYGLMSLLGLAAADDDGNKASGKEEKQEEKKEEQQEEPATFKDACSALESANSRQEIEAVIAMFSECKKYKPFQTECRKRLKTINTENSK